jgi:hypothetical protein
MQRLDACMDASTYKCFRWGPTLLIWRRAPVASILPQDGPAHTVVDSRQPLWISLTCLYLQACCRRPFSSSPHDLPLLSSFLSSFLSS